MPLARANILRDRLLILLLEAVELLSKQKASGVRACLKGCLQLFPQLFCCEGLVYNLQVIVVQVEHQYALDLI